MYIICASRVSLIYHNLSIHMFFMDISSWSIELLHRLPAGGGTATAGLDLDEGSAQRPATGGTDVSRFRKSLG